MDDLNEDALETAALALARAMLNSTDVMIMRTSKLRSHLVPARAFAKEAIETYLVARAKLGSQPSTKL